MESTATVLRVERGQADGEELAALTAVLAILRARNQAEPVQPPTLGWSWWQQTRRYTAPGSWR
jgi:hypothetical protein